MRQAVAEAASNESALQSAPNRFRSLGHHASTKTDRHSLHGIQSRLPFRHCLYPHEETRVVHARLLALFQSDAIPSVFSLRIASLSFYGTAHNCSIKADAAARRRLCQLLAGLAAWVIAMGGRANTVAFPGSAIRLLGTVRRRFQLEHSFGRFAVARMCLAARRAPRLRRDHFGRSASDQQVPTKLQLFVRIGADRWPGRAGACRLMGLSDLCPCGPSCSFLQPACAASRARPDWRGFEVAAFPDFHGFGVEKGVPGFMWCRLTRRQTGRRGGTAASTKPCRPGAG
jgi:hypothetical protein